MGIGDIGAVHDEAWGWWDTTCGGDDGRGEGREQDAVILSGPWLCEQYVSREPCIFWVGISGGSRFVHWACGFHGEDAIRADGMRGDRVGVRDIGEV